jgi:hypothetical protein
VQKTEVLINYPKNEIWILVLVVVEDEMQLTREQKLEVVERLFDFSPKGMMECSDVLWQEGDDFREVEAAIEEFGDQMKAVVMNWFTTSISEV